MGMSVKQKSIRVVMAARMLSIISFCFQDVPEQAVSQLVLFRSALLKEGILRDLLINFGACCYAIRFRKIRR